MNIRQSATRKLRQAADYAARKLRRSGKFAAAEIALKHTPPEPAAAPLPEPVPYDQWPEEIREFVKSFRGPGDAGAGDTAERELGRAGQEYQKARERLKVPCWCPDRKAWLNAKYDYRLLPT